MSRKRRPHRAQHAVHKQGAVEGSLSGLVVARYGAKVDVEDDEKGEVVRCTSRRKFGAVVCGDRITWQKTHDNEGIISSALPRSSLLARPDDIGRDKPIAANITQIIIVITVKALNNEDYYLYHNLIDRYIVAAEYLNITPLIVINKMDLLNDIEREQVNRDLKPYHEIGYQVIYTSTTLEHGMEMLEQQLKDHTSVFVGESGVGKSSIIQTLLKDLNIRIGEVSASSGKGKHTTTTTALFHLPCGGNLIDSPGVREFGLSKIEVAELAYSFIEFRPHIGLCKFNNCMHKSEPQCAVKAAVKAGEINQQRYDNYLAIFEALAIQPRLT